jgi:uncharacterized protein YktB (UPF0637 family)
MNDLRKAAEMALETLCVGANDAVPNDIDERFEQAIEALREALAEEALDRMVAENQRLGLYDDTAPPKRDSSSWVGLTDEERSYYLQAAANVGWWQAALFVEAKLKEKNS